MHVYQYVIILFCEKKPGKRQLNPIFMIPKYEMKHIIKLFYIKQERIRYCLLFEIESCALPTNFMGNMYRSRIPTNRVICDRCILCELIYTHIIWG